MTTYLPSRYSVFSNHDFFRFSVFGLFSILLHTAIVSLISLPEKTSHYLSQKNIAVNIKRKDVRLPIEQTISQIPSKKQPPKNIKQKPDKPVQNTSPSQSKPLKEIATQITPPIKNTIHKSEKLSQQLISEFLSSIPEIMLKHEQSQKEFEVFDPALLAKLEKARNEKTTHNEKQNELNLTVDDKNLEFDGYREAILNGNCWLIPDDISFDDLDVRIVMRNPNCDKPKNKLLNLIKSLK